MLSNRKCYPKLLEKIANVKKLRREQMGKIAFGNNQNQYKHS